jgi:hypothetical protein
MSRLCVRVGEVEAEAEEVTEGGAADANVEAAAAEAEAGAERAAVEDDAEESSPLGTTTPSCSCTTSIVFGLPQSGNDRWCLRTLFLLFCLVPSPCRCAAGITVKTSSRHDLATTRLTSSGDVKRARTARSTDVAGWKPWRMEYAIPRRMSCRSAWRRSY